MKAILYKSGMPVNLTDLATKPKYDIEGFLYQFTFFENSMDVRYCYYFKSEFKKNDQERTDLSDGFYREDMFLKYIHDKDGGVNLGVPTCSEMIYNYKFDFKDYNSFINANDLITVKLTDFESPYAFFYNKAKYNFNIQFYPNGHDIMNYAEPILDGFSQIEYKIKIPSGAVKEIIPVPNQNNTPGFHFYARNLGNYINTIASNNEKRRLKKITMLIIFKIREIVGNTNDNLNGVIDGIIPNIMHNIGFTDADLESLANSSSEINFENYKTDPVDAIKKLIFILKKTWGYYYIPGSTLIHRSNIPVIFDINSSYFEFEYYYIGLVSFYKTLYREPISNIPDFLKFEMILQFLPINALSILPLPLFKDILISFIKKRKLAEDEKRFVVRIVKSISNANANDFLDFLLDSNDCIHTNYELIYYILGDARVERYFVASAIADEIPTRKAFIFCVYELWKVSKYNFYYIPNGVTPILNNINPNSYFISNPDELQKDNILNFNSTYRVASNGDRITKKFEYAASLKNYKISISRMEITSIVKTDFTDSGYGAPAVGSINPLPPLPKKIGDFHLFHPIFLIGLEADLELELPQNGFYPAFIFPYIREFEDIKEFDATVSLAINITLELITAYFTGGLSSLRYLNYLKYTSRIYKALTGALAPIEQVLVWSALEGVSNALMISAAIFSSYNQYLIQLSNNQSEVDKLNKLNGILFYVILASGASSMAFRNKAIRAADEYLAFYPVGANPLPPDVEFLLNQLTNGRSTTLINIRTKINSLQLDDVNHIIAKFDDFAPQVKEALWEDFKNLTKQEWKTLNQSTAASIDRWQYLYNRNIIDRKFITVITNQIKVDNITHYYFYPQLKGVLAPLDAIQRWKFLNEFGEIEQDIFDKLVLNKEGVTLLMQSQRNLSNIKNFVNTSKTKEIIRYVTNENMLRQRILVNDNLFYDKVMQKFGNYVETQVVPESVIISMRSNFVNHPTVLNLSPDKLELFKNINFMPVTIKVYESNTLVNTFSKVYINKSTSAIDDIFGGANNIPTEFNFFRMNTNEYYQHKWFTSNALENVDDIKIWNPRYNDSEKHLILDMNMNILPSNNFTTFRYEVEMTSTLWSCPNCQQFLSSFVDDFEKIYKPQGHQLKMTLKGNPKLKSMQVSRDKFFND